MRKILIVLLILISAYSLQSCGNKANEGLRLYQVDPLKKVMKEQNYLRDKVDTMLIARGEVASIQIVAKGLSDVSDMKISLKDIQSEDGSSLLHATAGWVGYVYVGRSYTPPSDEMIRTHSDYFPDPILPDSAFAIEHGEVQPLWISVPTTGNDKPGLYKGTVEVRGIVNNSVQVWEKDFYIRVYPITLEKSPLFVSNWSAHFNPTVLGYMNNNEDVEIYSPLYWQLIEQHAEIMASHRQNVHRIYPVWHTQYTLVDGKYTFDFSRFDKEAEIFEKVGALERIEGGHIAWRSGAWDTPFHVEVPILDDENSKTLRPSPNPMKAENGIRFVTLPIEDKRAQNFLSQFLPALKAHLAEKQWLDKYMQHIADEPTVTNSKSYAEISKYIKKYMPEVKLVDAVLASKELAGTIDVWVPLLDVLHKDFEFFQNLQGQGKEIWYYTCGIPRANYANRLLEQPLIQTRYLHWINYKYNVTGYLHWGLNYWVKDQLNANASRDAGPLAAGDNCVVYPGYRKLYTSIRFETMRDGIDDYQLLTMLEKKKPELAKSLSKKLIENFDRYDGSITFFRESRKCMLDALCAE